MGEPEDSSRIAPAAPPVSRSVVVLARVLLLLVAVGAAATAGVIAVLDRQSASAVGAYGCPMDPEVKSSKAGRCPICGMALVKLADDGVALGHSGMPGMQDLTAVENVRKHKILDFVRMHALLRDLQELRGAAWVEPDLTISAVFYKDQVATIDADDDGSFTLTQSPDIAVKVRRTLDAPVPWDASTSRIRFSVATSGARAEKPALQPGAVGWIELERKPRSVLAVPADAVLQAPEGPYVLLALGGFKFEKRSIEIGETFRKQGFAVVLSGLRVHDRVVERATFFMDAERRLGNRAGEEAWVVK
ncbi:MAG TPA: heavy metal-binding domain-containing protein [Polyangiaceae bacterium]